MRDAGLVIGPECSDPLRGAPVAVFDFETTGPNPLTCEPVQVAVVHCNLGDTEPKVVFKSLINPGIPIPEGAQAVHHISDADVADADPWPVVLERLLPFFEGRVLGAYNLPFDWQILSRGVVDSGRDALALPFGSLDPLVWAKTVHRYERGKKLVDVAGRYGIEVDAHDAAGDALATALLMPRLLHDLGRHPDGGRGPLLSIRAIWDWTKAHGLKEDRGYARWCESKGRPTPNSAWHRLLGEPWPVPS